MNMTSYCDITNGIYPVTMTTISHCSILEFGRGAYNQAVAPGITRPLHATNLTRTSHPGHSTILLRSESPSSKRAKFHIVAASNNRDHTPRSLYCCFSRHNTGTFVAHITTFVVNCTFNTTPTERLQH